MVMFSGVFAQDQDAVCDVELKGTEYSLHLVELGETLYGISVKYNSKVDDIWEVNPTLVDNTIVPGQVIKVPKNSKDKGVVIITAEEGELIIENEEADAKLDSSQLVFHKVKKGETMFGISRAYDVSVIDLKKWNNLPDYNLSVGQNLIVSAYGEIKVYNEETSEVTSYKPSAKPIERSANINSRQDLLYQKYLNSSHSGKKINKQRGGAGKLVTNNPDMQTVYYALHKSAPVGSIVKVVNLVNRKSVFVTVLAPLPDIAENNNISVKLSPAASKDLVLLDGKSLVELSYYQ